MKDFLGNELKVGDEVVFMTCQEGEFQTGFIDYFDCDDDATEMSLIKPHNCWIYNTDLIKVIRQ
jgi:hypothetical protein